MPSEHSSFPPAVPPADSRKSARILVVDDDHSIRALFKIELEADGHRISCAGNGGEAMSLLHHGTFDLLITDLEMPVLDGYTLIRYVQRFWPTLPILICSGSSFDEEMPPDVLAVARAVLAKPLTPRELSEAVAAQLD